MKYRVLTAAAVIALGAATSAHATLFTFDPTGTPGAGGDIANVGIIDQAPGSAYADGGITAIQNFINGNPGTSFTLYYQANLGALQFTDTSIAFANGSGGNFFTFVAGFGETVATVGSNNSATFDFDPGNPVNFFTMYAASAIANNLTGTGFVTGTPILSGAVTAIGSSNFTVSDPDATSLDQSPNGDDWSGQDSVTGSGASDISLKVTSLNSNYFPTLDLGSNIVLSFFNNSQVDPFKTVDPSKCINNGGSCDLGTGIDITTLLGSVNGASGPSFLFQADANQTITVTSVPEPGTLALLGLGIVLLGTGFSRRRV